MAEVPASGFGGDKKAPREFLGSTAGQRCVQARLGLGGDKLDAPTDQHHSATVVPGMYTRQSPA
jgi:hypothetical protein